MKTVSILVADDHAVVRKGLRSILETHAGWEVCGEAANGRDAVALALSYRPDVVVMDINMPELNGLEATRQIAGALAGVRILILTAHDSEQLVLGTLSSGARGFVRKADAGEDLIEAIETLLTGRTYFTSSVTDVVMRGLRTGGGSSAVKERLSPREREVVQLLAEGKSNKEVATCLKISVKTVETHRKHIMAKLELHSLSDLVRYAIQNGIIEA